MKGYSTPTSMTKEAIESVAKQLFKNILDGMEDHTIEPKIQDHVAILRTLIIKVNDYVTFLEKHPEYEEFLCL